MNYKRLIIALVLPQLAGAIGSFFTISAIPVWYANLIKPSFSPPNWLFAPVWVILYFMLGLAVYLIWQKADKNKAVKNLLLIFWIHLFFNAIWSILFFGLHNPGIALVDILIIWVLILFLIIKGWGIDARFSYLLIPYFLWVSFASVLNYSIWYLN